MAKRVGDTLFLPQSPVIAAYAAIGGKKEGEGPLAACFDEVVADNTLGEESWEKAESEMQHRAVTACLRKAGAKQEDVSLLLAGDLQAQCTASNYTLRALGLPYLGIYGACSTMAETLGLAALLCSAGMAEGALALTSSHFCAAERQFRTPLDYGGMRTPSAQWTATAAGCLLVRPAGKGVPVRAVTFGRVQDFEVTDINNMGAAMAPAAASTLLHYLKDSATTPADYDVIFTGDLGAVGSSLLSGLMQDEGYPLPNHQDCGCLLYDAAAQKVNAGGSGAGCSASVLAGHILPKLQAGEYRKVLFVATGALMSQTTYLQGESIPGIAHLIALGDAAPVGGV
ncbi:MAG: stage V sporulation protein AD [Faecalibacterium sp.]